MSLRRSTRLFKNVRGGFYTSCARHSDSAQRDEVARASFPGQQKEKKPTEPSLPEEPKHCCMSGCANCVWIKYAQELAQMFENGDVIAKQKITEKVQDPKLRAFLLTQLGLTETGNKN